ncbi:MAG: sugar transporter [Oceanospirillaceae bacterium]|uniref:sugar transporter n=1 Tax=unclassified Thalassolituus TaxID=2624967 RepID=UPI000C5A15D1|nr:MULTISPECIES: sugar transporter [unclassified Thalassolituus]MAY01245.1 sugar transporter [Oceanospirillaceae bacterium]MBS53588.1 sugar transporter [Oceanospirillaceae bacterium]|tara:strand:- start:1095 stop:2321 length:1227 start_codon:yes stop_codon:yes gene_type:complete
MTDTPVSARSAWLPVVSLAFAAFVFNTSEFVPVGLLTGIADSFSMRIADTGLMMTMYAWVVSLASLPAIFIFSDTERRRLLIGVFILFVLSHVLSAVAWSFPILMVSRFGVALSHSVFWAITAAMVMRIAPLGKKTQAVSMLAAGSALASILGLPMGRLISEWFSWRTTFMIIGIVAAMVLVVVWRVMPVLPSQNAGSLKSLPLLIKRPALVGLYVLILLIVTAHFTAYSYIEPLVEKVLHFPSQLTTTLLFVYGLAGLAGTLLFSRLYSRWSLGVLFGSVAVVTLCLLTVLMLGKTHSGLLIVCAFWGVGMIFVTLASQLKTLELASDATDVATAAFSGIYNIGIGGGALVGSQIILGQGLSAITYAGGFIGIVALCWGLGFCLYFMRRAHRAAHEVVDTLPEHPAV